jgi:cell wall-associated NlpC family hydrolase
MAFVYPLEDVTEQKPLTVVPIGAVLEAGECGERWCRVTLPCGASGWIQKGDIVLRDALSPPKRLSPDETVALAKRFLGLPYLWAGTTPLGLDCSGFAQLVYRLSGVEILRDADMQFAGSGLLDVPAGQENKGDLVFFGKTAGEIGHVGIMVNREEFIHATTFEKPVVQISKLSHPHWKALYQGARRPKL